MKVFAAVAVALDDRCHVMLGELGLQVLEVEMGFIEPHTVHREIIFFRINDRHRRMIANEMSADWG